MIALLFICVFGGKVFAAEHGRTTATPGNGESFPLDITLNRDSMIVYPGTPDPPQDCFKQSVNLHVFSRGLVAIKIVDKDVCYIKQSSETYEEVKKRLKDIKKGHVEPLTQVTEEWVVPLEKVAEKDVEGRFGTKIANFCTGYDVLVLEDGHLVTAPGKRKSRNVQEGDCVNCYKCKVKTKAQLSEAFAA